MKRRAFLLFPPATVLAAAAPAIQHAAIAAPQAKAEERRETIIHLRGDTFDREAVRRLLEQLSREHPAIPMRVL